MLTELELSLQLALEFFGLQELPKEVKKTDKVVVLEGIAKVKKPANHENYVRVAADSNGKLTIKKDYGPSLPILEITNIYPTKTFDSKRFTPDLRSDKAIVEFLTKNGHNEDTINSLLSRIDKSPEEIKADRAKVKGWINDAAYSIANRTIAEERRCANMKSYAQRIKKQKQQDGEE